MMKSDAYREWRSAMAVRRRYFDGLGFSSRVAAALSEAEYDTIQQVAGASDGELLRLPNFGKRALAEVRSVTRGSTSFRGDLRTALSLAIERLETTLADLKEQRRRLDEGRDP
jgi:DNA-directed RNA polymerase alpha subunit